MLKGLMKRVREDEGFTLIELMVVVLIIGILIAIALPTFLGARTRAQNRAAQSDLRNALVAAKTIYTDASSYQCATGVAPVAPCTQNLSNIEPGLPFVGVAATANNVMVLPLPAAGPYTQWAGARLSASGYCFYISDDSAVGTRYGQSAAGNQANCTASMANAAALSWS